MAEGTWNKTFPALVEHTKAKGSDVNTRVNGLGSNYDMLPSPHDDGKKGFFGPCYVGAATELGHTVSSEQVRNGAITHGVDSGTANTYVITNTVPSTAYVAGMRLTFVANSTNTGASTVNVDGLGIVSLKASNDTELSDGFISEDDIVEIAYSGTFFQILSISGHTADAATSAAAAAASASAAADSATEAAASETVCLSSSNYIGEWGDQTGAHLIPTSVSHNGEYWMLIQNVADITTQEPGSSPTYWKVIETVPSRVGEIFMWPLDTPPSYALMCDGSAIPAEYTELIALIGPNTPNIGSFVKNSQGTNTLTNEAESVGTHGHTADAVEDHTHTISVNSVGNHTHSSAAASSGISANASGTSAAAQEGSSTGSAGAHGHTASAGNAGGHTPVIQDHMGVNQPACTLVNFCIRTE